jgi:hypothetical protein
LVRAATVANARSQSFHGASRRNESAPMADAASLNRGL